jgi:hypothetical protein
MGVSVAMEVASATAEVAAGTGTGQPGSGMTASAEPPAILSSVCNAVEYVGHPGPGLCGGGVRSKVSVSDQLRALKISYF